MRKTIGIDIGTTSISGVVYDVEQDEVLWSEMVESGSFVETYNSWERVQDVAVIVEKTRLLLDRLLQRFPEIEAIGLTGQMHGIVYVNAEGTAVSPLFTWQDGSGDIPVEEFGGKTLVEKIVTETGCVVATGYGLVTYACHVINEKVPAEAVSVCTIADYFGMQLTRRNKPLVHASNAASLGFWDVRKACFDKEALEKLGLEMSILPETTSEVAVLGKYCGIPVSISLGDNQASFLGAVGTQDDAVLVNIGTGGQVSVLSEMCDSAPGIEVRPFLHGKNLSVGASLCGGRAYAVLEKFLRNYVKAATGIDESQYNVMEKIAKDCDSLRVKTTFSGTRVNKAELGEISNITEDNFLPEFIIYGFMKGIVEELCEMYCKMSEITGGQEKILIASGNGMRKNSTMQKIGETVFGMKLVLAKHKEEAACGAAILAEMTSLGTGL